MPSGEGLAVVRTAGRDKHGALVLECACACGAVVFVAKSNLGRQRGCLRCFVERSIKRHTTHGHAGVGHVTREYSLWLVMKDRCLNPGSRNFHNYGGRGIRVCDEWQDSFEAFLRDMGPRPSPGHSIERREVDGHYEPGNCAWATRQEQAANTRRNRFVLLDGERVHVAEAARRTGLGVATIASRRKRGWPEEKLLLPADNHRHLLPKTGRPSTVMVEFGGRQVSLRDAAAMSGVGYGTIKSRLGRGDVGEALFRSARTRKGRKRA